MNVIFAIAFAALSVWHGVRADLVVGLVDCVLAAVFGTKVYLAAVDAAEARALAAFERKVNAAVVEFRRNMECMLRNPPVVVILVDHDVHCVRIPVTLKERP